MGEGEVRVALGNLAALRARSHGNQTGLRVVLGSARVDEAPPPSGLVATGRAGTLDVVDWIALATLLPAALHLANQVLRADPKDGELALKLFRSNRTCGFLIFLGLLVVGLTSR